MCSFVQSCAITQCSLAAKGPRGRGLERIFAGRCRCSSAHDEEESDKELHLVVLLALDVRGKGRQGSWKGDGKRKGGE